MLSIKTTLCGSDRELLFPIFHEPFAFCPKLISLLEITVRAEQLKIKYQNAKILKDLI